MIEYNKDRKDLQVDKLFEDFIEECEKKASELQIPVDYYIAEFTWLFFLEWLLVHYSQSVQHLLLLLAMILTIWTTDSKIKR